MILVTKQEAISIPTTDVRHRILHIFTAQVRNASNGSTPPRDAVPSVLDLTTGRWDEAIKLYSPDSRITHLSNQETEDQREGRWIVSDFMLASQTLEGSFDWVLGDGSILEEQRTSQTQLIRGSLKMLRQGGWLGLFLPLNYMIYSPRRYLRNQLTPQQLWLYTQSLVSLPYGLHIWQKGRSHEGLKTEWFE